MSSFQRMMTRVESGVEAEGTVPARGGHDDRADYSDAKTEDSDCQKQQLHNRLVMTETTLERKEFLRILPVQIFTLYNTIPPLSHEKIILNNTAIAHILMLIWFH